MYAMRIRESFDCGAGMESRLDERKVLRMHAGFSGRPRSSMNQAIIEDAAHPMNDGALRATAKPIGALGPVADDR